MNRVVVRFDRKLSKRKNGLTVQNRIPFDDKVEAEFWIAAMQKFDDGNTFQNYRVEVQ